MTRLPCARRFFSHASRSNPIAAITAGQHIVLCSVLLGGDQ
jgi:hypothetical protein